MIRPRQLNADRGPVAADVGRTVLVVEDDDDLGDLLRAVVTDAGYAAAILPDARPAAVRAAGELPPGCSSPWSWSGRSSGSSPDEESPRRTSSGRKAGARMRV